MIIEYNALSRVLTPGETIVIVDPKGDTAGNDKLRQAVRRMTLLREECKRRKVRFLPLQVMRPIYALNHVSGHINGRNFADCFAGRFVSEFFCY